MNGGYYLDLPFSEGTIKYLSQDGAEKKMLFSYNRFIRERRLIEKNRPSLLRTFGVNNGLSDVEISTRLMHALRGDILSARDKKVLRDYLMNMELEGIVDVALSERLSGKEVDRDREIIKDLFFEKLSFEEAMEKYGLSIITIKRIKRKGIEAVREEIQFRLRMQSSLVPELMCVP